MPKWWATSWTTVTRTSSTSCSAVSQMSSSGPRKRKIRSGSPADAQESRWVSATPVVEPEQVVGLLGRRLLLDEHHDVAHQRGQLLGDLVERGLDQGVEARRVGDQGVERVEWHRSIVPEKHESSEP